MGSGSHAFAQLHDAALHHHAAGGAAGPGRTLAEDSADTIAATKAVPGKATSGHAPMTTRPASRCEGLSAGRRVTSGAPEPHVDSIIVGHAVIHSGKTGKEWGGAAHALKDQTGKEAG